MKQIQVAVGWNRLELNEPAEHHSRLVVSLENRSGEMLKKSEVWIRTGETTVQLSSLASIETEFLVSCQQAFFFPHQLCFAINGVKRRLPLNMTELKQMYDTFAEGSFKHSISKVFAFKGGNLFYKTCTLEVVSVNEPALQAQLSSQSTILTPQTLKRITHDASRLSQPSFIRKRADSDILDQQKEEVKAQNNSTLLQNLDEQGEFKLQQTGFEEPKQQEGDLLRSTVKKMAWVRKNSHKPHHEDSLEAVSSYENDDLKEQQKRIDTSVSQKMNLVYLLLLLGAIVLGYHLYTTPIPKSRKPSPSKPKSHHKVKK